jgi:hypothetical protein
MVYLLTKQLKLPPAGSSRGQVHAGRSHRAMGHEAGLKPGKRLPEGTVIQLKPRDAPSLECFWA